MNLSDIESTGFILALFIRNDGLRFLLGTGAYEFKNSQLHFAPNSIENDVVSVQGNDGYLLAGQVRRPNTQVFDGYIGDATTIRSQIESYRRDFIAFFQKNYFYTVVYVLPSGKAIQRKRGFLVDAPSVKELYQIFPEYHIGLNFEDVNYYEYSENEAGEETYGKLADIGVVLAKSGGLIWDDLTIGSKIASGTDFNIQGTTDGTALDSVQLKGNTYQKIISGKNLFNDTAYTNKSGYANVELGSGSVKVIQNNASGGNAWVLFQVDATSLANQSVVISMKATYGSGSNGTRVRFTKSDGTGEIAATLNPTASGDYRTFTVPSNGAFNIYFYINASNVQGAVGAYSEYTDIQLEAGSTPTAYEPYVGGVASPNPDYPQNVELVSGEQTIFVNNASQSKNLLPILDGTITYNGLTVSASDGEITIDGTTTANTWIKLTNSIDAISGSSIDSQWLEESTGINNLNGKTISFRYVSGTPAGSSWAFRIYGSSSTYLNQWRTGTTDTTYSWTNNTNAVSCIAAYVNSGYTFTDYKVKIQIEQGSEATAFVPYVKSNYKIYLGTENLFDPSTVTSSSYLNADGTVDLGHTGYETSDFIEIDPTRPIDKNATASPRVKLYDSNKVAISTAQYGDIANFRDAGRFDIPYPNARYIRFTIYTPLHSVANVEVKQPTIELCKIGDYQDYIYKSGEDWYVHKETAKVAVSDGTYTLTNGCPQSSNSFPSDRKTETSAYYKYGRFNPVTTGITGTLLAGQFGWNTANRLTFAKYDFASLQAFTDFVTNNNPYVYYVLVTATDTQITNSALITQLDALDSATTYSPTTWFKSSSSTDLPVIVQAEVQAYAPSGVIWDNIGATWDGEGGSSYTIVSVDSIESVYPTWKVIGPANNPILTNATTGTSISYAGNVANGQTLTIDMLNKTAYLNGTSVIQKVSGNWIELEPGNNRISYTTDNAISTPNSQIMWQEIIG